MKNLLSKWWFHLTGGRPMKYLHYEFTDKVVGRGVLRFEDPRDGTHWLAFHAWDLGRMRPASHFSGE